MPMVIANRYARALADVVARTGDYRKVLQELEDFYSAYKESGELREICETPAVPLAKKLQIVDAVVERTGGSPVTRNFLRVLLSNYRMALLDEALEAFRRIAYDRLGIVQVKVSTASELSAAERETLRGRFAALTRKQAELEFSLDRGLIGGIVAQIGSTVYDGSVRTQLERLRQQLMAR